MLENEKGGGESFLCATHQLLQIHIPITKMKISQVLTELKGVQE